YREPVTGWLDEADGYNTLRNNICHAVWTEGKRPLSIKPLTLNLRGGKGKMVGTDDSDKDYTEIELALIADRLRKIHNELHKFLKTNFPNALPA
ncbi:MAG: hypothetical protein G4V63_01310, partial [Candidatus Afipia apatlaquensis]|nr:hypothetical protein [Candidatus Afipia apatlaquensis]